MSKLDLRSYLGLLVLSIGVYFLRQDHGSLIGYISSTVIVLAFWYLNGLSLALSNLRNILLIILVFGVFAVGARIAFPSASDSAKMGLMFGQDLDPGAIARLKESHAIALDLYFDHQPTNEERYYKVASLPFSEDGLHYSSKKTELDLVRLPRASAWVGENLTAYNLEGKLDRVRAWFTKEFSYSLTPGALRSREPLDEFLFESKKGFCEHYAAALVTLLKLSGVKARLNVGYAGGRWNPLFRSLTFEESDAHAWAEVQDTVGKTWRIVDPTDWVHPGVLESETHFSLSWIIVSMLALGLGLGLVLGRTRKDGVSALLAMIERMENKQGLKSSGLTISERFERIIKLNPANGEKMRSSLSLYLNLYYANEPTVDGENKLKESLSRWK